MARRRLAAGQAYSGRREDVAVINCTIDRDAATLLRHYASGKTLGRLVARLIFEHHARQQERQRLREHMQTLLMEEKAE